MGTGAGRRGTGVRYADVAGIDHVKADIDAIMAAVLGKGGYSEIGVRPPRVRPHQGSCWGMWSTLKMQPCSRVCYSTGGISCKQFARAGRAS